MPAGDNGRKKATRKRLRRVYPKIPESIHFHIHEPDGIEVRYEVGPMVITARVETVAESMALAAALREMPEMPSAKDYHRGRLDELEALHNQLGTNRLVSPRAARDLTDWLEERLRLVRFQAEGNA